MNDLDAERHSESPPLRVWGDMGKSNGWPLTQSEAIKRIWDQEGHPYVEYVLVDEVWDIAQEALKGAVEARDELLTELRHHAELHSQRGYGGDSERAWAIWHRFEKDGVRVDPDDVSAEHPTIMAALRALGITLGADEINGRWGVEADAPIVDWCALHKLVLRQQEVLERERAEDAD